MRIEGVQPLPHAPQPGNVPQPATGSTQNFVGALQAIDQKHGGGGGGGHGHGKKSGLDAIQQASDKAALAVQPRLKTVDERRAEIERLGALYRAHSERVGKRDDDDEEEERNTGASADAMSAVFLDFVSAVHAALAVEGCLVQRLRGDECSATLAVSSSGQTKADRIRLFFWNDGADSKIAAFIERYSRTPDVMQRDVLPPFTPESAAEFAAQALVFLQEG